MSSDQTSEDPQNWPPAPWNPGSLGDEPWPPEPWRPDTPQPASSPADPSQPEPWRLDAPQPGSSPADASQPESPWRPSPLDATPEPPTPAPAAPWKPPPWRPDFTNSDPTPWTPGSLGTEPWQPEPTQADPTLRTPGSLGSEPWQPANADPTLRIPGPSGAEPWRPEPTNADPTPWEPGSLGTEAWPSDQPWRIGAGDAGGPQRAAEVFVPPPAREAPAPWRPQHEPKRRRTAPLLIGAWAIVMLAAVAALGIVFWPTGDHAPQGAVSPQTGGTTSDSVPASPEGTVSGGGTQATEVNSLLDGMASSRSELGKAMTAAAQCSALSDALPTIQKVVGEREQQLAKAKTLQVGALDSGDQLKDSLTRALQASLDADRAYLKWADNAQGCSGDTPTDSNMELGNSISETKATPAKEEFLGLWAPVAAKEQQPARDKDHI